MKKEKLKYIIGIDEAGRGALAGPVSVGGILVTHDFDFSLFSKVKDSKQLSAKIREGVFREVQKAIKEGLLSYHVALISEKVIDTKGITYAVRKGVEEILKKLAISPDQVSILLDGSLYAPKEYLFQKTIIKGDVTEPAISLASIMAKVTRDKKMISLQKKYPQYFFEIHKGYGTLLHREAITAHGLSAVHRRSFCKRWH
ncbi:ribonuclease HII [Patescibacteria group bacterium]|nr:ribonuclease HII [Patescibacteria group bacterium]